jgi:predicted dehydrogenase
VQATLVQAANTPEKDEPVLSREEFALGDELRLGVIGAGGMGRGHVAAIKANDGISLAAVADTNPEAVSAAIEGTEAAGFADYSEMVEQVELDGLVAIVPHHLHRVVVDKACEVGLPLLKEKPLARNMEEAVKFVEMTEQAGITFMLATQRRFIESYARLKEIAGNLGDIFLARGQYVFRWSRDFAWRGQWETAGGGALHDMGYHTVDMLIWYLGMPEWVQTEWSAAAFSQWDYETDDTAITMFGYKSGTIGYLLTTWATSPSEETFFLHGTEGVAVADRKGIRHTDLSDSLIEEIPVGGAGGGGLHNQMAHFAHCIRTGEEPLTAARTNLQNMAFIEAAYRSAAEQRRIEPASYLPGPADA